MKNVYILQLYQFVPYEEARGDNGQEKSLRQHEEKNLKRNQIQKKSLLDDTR